MNFRFVAMLSLFSAVLTGLAQAEIRAQIVDPSGGAVTNATITVHAVKRESGTRYGDPDVDASAKTDAKGEFLIKGKSAFRSATLSVEAPGWARGVFSDVPAGEALHQLPLVNGVSVVGSLSKDGNPMEAVEVAVSDVEQNSKVFKLERTATTDARGRFRISNLPPKQDFYFFARMNPLGSVPSRRIRTDADGSVLELGEIKMEPALTVEGRVAGGPATEITLGRWKGSDQQRTKPDPEGRFRFNCVPAEIISLSLNAPGHRLSLRNASLNPASPNQLTGLLTTNKPDLVIELEPGEDHDPLNISTIAAASEPLRGIESPKAGPETFAVSGTVIDAETGEKIATFETTEGRVDRGDSYDWFFTRIERHTNGAFATHLTRGEYPPLLVVQSDNHIPWVSPPIYGPTNFSIALAKGVHPKGVVLKPDGSPATNVTVCLADATSTSTFSDGGVTQRARTTQTDARGRFRFFPQRGVVSVIVYDRKIGFAETPIADLLRTGEVRLQTLAKVQGQLKIGANAASNEIVRLATAPAPYQWYPRELPAYSVTLTAKTDTDGNFSFDSVPPTLMELGHSPGTATSAVGAMPVTQARRVSPEAGSVVTVNLGGWGRPVVGRAEVTGFEDGIDWRRSINTIENVVPHDGPSDAALKSLIEKLAATARDPHALKAYQHERAAFAAATKNYFATEKGKTALMATRRYIMQFETDGTFRVDDLPAGKYLVTLHLLSADPAKMFVPSGGIASSKIEIEIPEGTTPFDLGTLKVAPTTRANR